MQKSDWTQYKLIYDTIRVNKSYWPPIDFGPFYNWSVGQELLDAAAECPDKIALVDGVPDHTKRRRWTYAQLLADAEKVASALLDKFRPGERIGIWAANRPEWIIAEYGCALAGLVIIPLNPDYRERELEYEVQQSNAAGIICADEYQGFNMLDCALIVQKRIPSLREIIRFSEWNEFISSGSNSIPLPEVKPDDPLFQIYTSGTTGQPKGAILHHMGTLNTEFHFGEFCVLGEDGVFVQMLPLFLIATCGLAVFSCLTHRAQLVILPEDNIENLLDCIQQERGTMLQLPTVIINQILKIPGARDKMKTIRTIGSMEYKKTTIDQIHETIGENIAVLTGFGQTEAHGLLVMAHPNHSPEEMTKDSRAGKPFPRTEIAITDPLTHEILPLDTVGEISFRGFHNMLGYYNMPQQTAATIRPDGWQGTGDLGAMDEEGWISVKGRLKDMIRRGSQNIYPREVESLLLQHPKVENAIVLGMPSEEWGEEVTAVVTPVSIDDMPTALELYDFCHENMTYYKNPRLWCITTEALPHTPSGKAQKYGLRDAILAGDFTLERT